MALRRRGGGGGNGLDAWPGYVDALSTLLMVIIFVLLVFVLAQAFLSVALSGRDRALDQANQQLAELSDMLSLERGRTADLTLSVATLSKQLQTATSARDSLTSQLAAAQAAAAASATQVTQLQAALAAGTTRAETAEQQAKSLAAALAERDATIKADRATIEARLSDLAKLTEQTKALTALRDELQKQAADAAARATTEAERHAATEKMLSDEKNLGDSARAQIALLNAQVAQLRAQLGQLSKDLDLAQSAMTDKDTQIANLGQRLNAALASKVEELQQYRSEFFGKLRALLAGRPGISIVGDRFVFQSEVLFPVGSAELTPAGVDQINALATTIKQIASEIPPNLPWIMRVDGHADRQPVSGGQFASNWELSAERAINVVKLLVIEGVPPEHLAAAAFSDYQPIDTADTPAAFAKNRRIELRLTDR
jgi:chemotaxis protein MotB